MALRMTVLQLLISMTLFEVYFNTWQKLPFTCSHVPGQRPLALEVAKYIGLLCALVPFLSVIIAVAAQVWVLFPFFLAGFGALWFVMRRRRLEGWGEAPLLYEDLPAVVTDLGIKELTYAGAQAQLRRAAAGHAGHADP